VSPPQRSGGPHIWAPAAAPEGGEEPWAWPCGFGGAGARRGGCCEALSVRWGRPRRLRVAEGAGGARLRAVGEERGVRGRSLVSSQWVCFHTRKAGFSVTFLTIVSSDVEACAVSLCSSGFHPENFVCSVFC